MATIQELTAIPEGQTASETFVKIVHEPTGNVSEVSVSALPVWFRAGWALLDESTEPEPEAEPEPPQPVKASKLGAATAASK